MPVVRRVIMCRGFCLLPFCLLTVGPNYCTAGAELLQLSEKALDAKVRELENWNFRLNLDEGAAAGAVGEFAEVATRC